MEVSPPPNELIITPPYLFQNVFYEHLIEIGITDATLELQPDRHIGKPSTSLRKMYACHSLTLETRIHSPYLSAV